MEAEQEVKEASNKARKTKINCEKKSQMQVLYLNEM